MKVIYCHSCDEVFSEYEMIIPNHCPICGAHDMMEVLNNESAKRLSGRLIENVFSMFGDVGCNDDEQIDEEFLGFPVGTYRSEIWHWFDEVYTDGVYKLMFG